MQSSDLADLSPAAGLLSALTRIEYYTAEGEPIASWASSGSGATLPFSVDEVLRNLRATHRPMTRLTCVRECVMHAFVPAFDRDGREISMIVSQLASDQLQAFRRVAGADVALMESGDTVQPINRCRNCGVGICVCSPMLRRWCPCWPS